eukprot:1142473-Pelagomonas_calceolata.AAC.12
MPEGKGPEWDCVTVAEPDEEKEKSKAKSECKLWHCKLKGGATRIRQHFLKVSGRSNRDLRQQGAQAWMA